MRSIYINYIFKHYGIIFCKTKHRMYKYYHECFYHNDMVVKR
jgi:hypothetical protein